MMALLAALLLQSGNAWFQDDVLYRHPLADPRAPGSGSRVQVPLRRGDHVKLENAFGDHRSIVRFSRPDEAFEVGIEGAAFGRFDAREALDMDGVDFRFGFPVAYRRGRWAFKLHPWHLTSHLGDEFIEREGRERIAYGRNELAVGVAWSPSEAWRLHAEVGWGFWIRPVNEPWRAQAGAEFVDRLLGAGAPEVYAATNVTLFQEIDWEALFSVQAGVWLRPAGSTRGIRVGLEYFRGHSALTQFFREHEHYVSAGFWIHF